MSVDVEFMIEGTGARIENRELIEGTVEEDTSYSIVARYDDLEERQERTVYAPPEVLKPAVKQELEDNGLGYLVTE